MWCKHLLIIRELSALLHTMHEIPPRSEGWGEILYPSPVWDTWSLILHPLRRMRCKHLLIIRELSALLQTIHEIPHKSEGWRECFISPPLSGIPRALFYIPSEGCGASTYSNLGAEWTPTNKTKQAMWL